jgi:hypothetical protein
MHGWAGGPWCDVGVAIIWRLAWCRGVVICQCLAGPQLWRVPKDRQVAGAAPSASTGSSDEQPWILTCRGLQQVYVCVISLLCTSRGWSNVLHKC